MYLFLILSKSRLKRQYLNPTTGKTDYFDEPIVFTLFPPFFATIIGLVFIFFEKKQQANDYSNK